ncbi:hypothetical protein ACWEQL_01215 [Kitasatospora sp. NPDC004240]
MNTPRCGKCRLPVECGPYGGYVCGSCYYVVPPPRDAGPPAGTVVPSAIGLSGGHCERCGAEVIQGPLGGYVCGMCNHVVEPPGAEHARREAAKLRADRREDTPHRRRTARSRSSHPSAP